MEGDRFSGRWGLVVAAGLVIFMAQLDVTIVAVALPTIERDLGVTTTVAEWVALGYVVPLIALTLLSGRWLDSVPHRHALALGTIGFAAASLAAGLSPTIGPLIAARAVQGAFAALLVALAPVLAVNAAPPEAKGRALGVVSALAPLGAVTGPVVGGQLVDVAGWPSIFLVNVPIAIAVVLLGCRELPAGAPLPAPRPEWLGEAALLGGAAVALLLALSLAPSHGLAWLALLAVIPPLLVTWRRTATSRPVRQLIRTPGLREAHVALVASYTALLLVQFLLPFYLSRTLGLSAAATGLTLLAYPAATALVGPLAGGLADRRGARGVAVVGAVILGVGLAVVAPLDVTWRPLDLAWRLAAVGVGFGLLGTPVQAIVLALAPRQLLATTSASTNLARQIGIAIGPALGTAVWASSGYHLIGMRAALALAAAVSAVAVAALWLLPTPGAGPPGEEPAAGPAKDWRPATPAIANQDLSCPTSDPTSERKTMSLKVAVIYYSSTGNVHALAEAVADGAAEAGAVVRLRRVAELAPDAAIDSNPDWRAHLAATADIPVATHDDLRWADAYAFGTPTRYGNISSQLKQFIDTTAGLWAAGDLADKPVTAFTSAVNRHGGNESTLLALYNTMHHWGCVIVPPGYTSPEIGAAGGNPYGVAHASGDGLPTKEVLAAARYQGRRLVLFGEALLTVRAVEPAAA